MAARTSSSAALHEVVVAGLRGVFGDPHSSSASNCLIAALDCGLRQSFVIGRVNESRYSQSDHFIGHQSGHEFDNRKAGLDIARAPAVFILKANPQVVEPGPTPFNRPSIAVFVLRAER